MFQNSLSALTCLRIIPKRLEISYILIDESSNPYNSTRVIRHKVETGVRFTHLILFRDIPSIQRGLCVKQKASEMGYDLKLKNV